MNVYKLSPLSRFIDPKWLNQTRGGLAQVKNGQVILNGQNMVFVQRPTPVLEGAWVEIWLDQNGFFVCALHSEMEARRAQRAAEEKRQTEAQAAQREAARAAALAFNAALSIPVRWTPGIKDVLSGLSATSDGSGRNKRTVVHVLLQEVLDEPRLKRSAGSFLCTSARGSDGRRWAQQVEEACNKVTCKQCIALAKRWSA